MPNQQLLDYINSQRALGQTDAQIRQALAAAGWPEALVNEGFAPNSGQTAGTVPPPVSAVRTATAQNPPAVFPKLSADEGTDFSYVRQRTATYSQPNRSDNLKRHYLVPF